MPFGPPIDALLPERTVIHTRSVPVDLQVMIDSVRHRLAHGGDVVPQLHSTSASSCLLAASTLGTLAVVPGEEPLCGTLDPVIHAIACHQMKMGVRPPPQRRSRRMHCELIRLSWCQHFNDIRYQRSILLSRQLIG